MNELANTIVDAVSEIKKDLQSGSDYTAKVTKVEGQTAYVQITGSDIADTPVAKSVSCKPGDMVRVRVADGKAWITGNDTEPPADNGLAEDTKATLDNFFSKFSADDFGNCTAIGKLISKGALFNAIVECICKMGKVSIGKEYPIMLSPAAYPDSMIPKTGAIEIATQDNSYKLFVGGSYVSASTAGQHKAFFLSPETCLLFNDGNSGDRAYVLAHPEKIEVHNTEGYCYFNGTGAHPQSDIRLKTDIVTMDPELAKKLKPVTYRFKGSDKIRYGFIAQDVREVLPDAVAENDDGFLTLNYSEIIAPLTALVQQQEERINQLEARLKALEDKENG